MSAFLFFSLIGVVFAVVGRLLLKSYRFEGLGVAACFASVLAESMGFLCLVYWLMGPVAFNIALGVLAVSAVATVIKIMNR